MKVRFITYFVLFISTIIISCSKDDVSPDQPQEQTGDFLFARLQQGTDPESDSVYLISYDEQKRIKSIVDSTHTRTLTPAYDNSGNLSSFTESYIGLSSTTFKYNAANQLTEISTTEKLYAAPGRYTFEYTNGVISKKSYFAQTNSDNSTLNLSKYWIYAVTNGNITNRKEYDANGTLVSEAVFTYTTEPNIFKSMALINFTNFFGVLELANEDNFFNKNMISTVTEGDEKITYTYTYDDEKQLTKLIASSPFRIHTRMFSY